MTSGGVYHAASNLPDAEEAKSMDRNAAFLEAFVFPYRLSNVLVVIPAYNEEACVADVVRRVFESGFARALVVDDGSADRTAVEANRAGASVLTLPYNLGIGGAVQAGLKFAVRAGYSYAVRIDADGQHDIREAQKLLRAVQEGEADVAIGSRFIPGHQTYVPPFSRALGIRWFAALVSWIIKTPVYDTTSGMQAMNRRALVILAENYPQDYPEVEARILLNKARLRVIEIPVKMAPRAAGMSSITYMRAIYYMFKVSLATIVAALRRVPRQLPRRLPGST
jgi:glycosyltransferase involved in cell wall biosynthesis